MSNKVKDFPLSLYCFFTHHEEEKDDGGSIIKPWDCYTVSLEYLNEKKEELDLSVEDTVELCLLDNGDSRIVVSGIFKENHALYRKAVDLIKFEVERKRTIEFENVN